MSLPKQVKIGGFPLRVIYGDVEINSTEPSANGLFDANDGLILIRNTKVVREDEEVAFPQTRVTESFLHELIHGIDYIYCDADFTEEQVDLLSTGLYSVFRDNQLDIAEDIFKPLKSVKILGFTHKVKYFKRPDSPQQIVQCADILEINILEHGCDYRMKHRLLSGVLCAIACQLNIDLDVDMLMQFAHGLIQVCQDTKIEKLIKEKK